MKPLNLFRLLPAVACVIAYSSGAAGEEPVSRGEDFYYRSVMPRFETSDCRMCHDFGHIFPSMRYQDMRQYLAMGTSRSNNVLIYKLANERGTTAHGPVHIGGQFCSSPDSEPCRTLKSWWDVEFETKGTRNDQ